MASFSIDSLVSGVDFSKFSDVTKLMNNFNNFNMDALQERMQEEEEAALVQERERRGSASVPLPQLQSAGGSVGVDTAADAAAWRTLGAYASSAVATSFPSSSYTRNDSSSLNSRRDSVAATLPPLPPMPIDSRRASLAPGLEHRRGSLAAAARASAAIAAAGPAASKAAEEAFLADMTAAGLDPNAKPDPIFSEPPTPHAFFSTTNTVTPGAVGKRSTSQYNQQPLTATGDNEGSGANPGDIFASLNLDAASSVFGGAVARAKAAAGGVADTLSDTLGQTVAAVSLAAPVVAAAAAGDWLRGYVVASQGGAPSAAPQMQPTAPGSLRRGPATAADRSIFAMLRGEMGGGKDSPAPESRDGIPIVSFSRGGAGGGLNPASLGGMSGAGSNLCTSLFERGEAACGSFLAPLCCALVPLSLCVRSVAMCGAAVAACAGCSVFSLTLRQFAFAATPRVVFSLLLVSALFYALWHSGLTSSEGVGTTNGGGALLVGALVERPPEPTTNTPRLLHRLLRGGGKITN